MIKQIVQHSAKLIEFLVLLQLNLSKPQYRHVLNIAESAIVCDSPHKTLTMLYDLIVDAPHPSNAADCLRISPWLAIDLREPLRDPALVSIENHTSYALQNSGISPCLLYCLMRMQEIV